MLLSALVAGICLALSLAPLGCFLMWRRQGFFGDAMAHSALLGVSASFLYDFTPLWGIFGVCVGLSALLAYGPLFFRIPPDSWLSLLSYTLMAFAFILMKALPKSGDRSAVQVDNFLFGDLLLLDTHDLLILAGITVLTAVFLSIFWRRLLLITLDSDWAAVEGIPVSHVLFAFLLMLSCVVSVTIPIIGALLVPSLLLLPAACAVQLSNTPAGMVARSVLFSCLLISSGIALAFYQDWPVGPSCVVVGFSLFILTRCYLIKK